MHNTVWYVRQTIRLDFYTYNPLSVTLFHLLSIILSRLQPSTFNLQPSTFNLSQTTTHSQTDIMHFTLILPTLLTLAAAMPAASPNVKELVARQDVGPPYYGCVNRPQYVCNSSKKQILVCNGSYFVLSAVCGPGGCVDTGSGPHCV